MAIIKIFDENDRDFSSNGNIAINPTKCKEIKKKSLNGWCIEVECNVKYKDYIEQDKLCVVQTKSKLNPQAFRINNIKVENKIISFIANHVMFDSEKYFLVDVRPTKLNGQNALSYINERTDKISPFTIFSDVGTQDTAYFIRKNMLEAWAVIEERWGGTFDADNWQISFRKKVGNDNGETIIYGKNMQGMQIYEDWSSVCTRIYPVGPNELLLDEKYIDSDIQYPIPYTRTISFTSDLEAEEGQEISEEELKKELREKAEKYLETNKYPQVSYEVNSNINQNMEIGDTIHVKHPLVDLVTEVLEYEHNILTDKIETLVFGNYVRNVKNKFDGIKNSLQNMTEQLYEGITRQDIVIRQQTELINSLNKKGFVYIDDNEILILDAIPKEKAKNVWRFGLGGLGFSSNGYEGPFETAITMDGQINAKFITTGTMAVARIEGLQNQLNGILTNISLNADNIKSLVASQEEDTEYLETLITQTKNTITSEVNKKVNNSEFGTKIQQSFSDIQIAWNNISKYIQFINGSLRIKDSGNRDLIKLDSYGLYLYDTDGSTTKMRLDRTGQRFYENGEYIGNIGTNSLQKDTSKKGLSFDLDVRGSYMTWASKDSEDNIYNMKLWVAKEGNGVLAEGLVLGTDLDTNGYSIKFTPDTNSVRWSNGGAGIKTYSRFSFTGGNNDTYLEINPLESQVNIHKELDMNGFNIINAGDVASDGRLKAKIYTSQIKALDRIKQIKHRQFKWKKDNKQEDIGFIAQEMELIDKNYVRHNYKEDEKGNIIQDSYEMRLLPILATATKAIQEQQELIEKQQKQINMLLQKLNLPQEDPPIENEEFIEEPETKYNGQAVIEETKILEEAPKYVTKMKKLDNDEVEIYQEIDSKGGNKI